MSYKFFQNCDCEYFPCHLIPDENCDKFNCLFCFCPLHYLDDCGGDFTRTDKGVKDCSLCTRPHYDYDGIIDRLILESQKKENHPE